LPLILHSLGYCHCLRHRFVAAKHELLSEKLLSHRYTLDLDSVIVLSIFFTLSMTYGGNPAFFAIFPSVVILIFFLFVLYVCPLIIFFILSFLLSFNRLSR
jgi:hypothetical protein